MMYARVENGQVVELIGSTPTAIEVDSEEPVYEWQEVEVTDKREETNEAGEPETITETRVELQHVDTGRTEVRRTWMTGTQDLPPEELAEYGWLEVIDHTGEPLEAGTVIDGNPEVTLEEGAPHLRHTVRKLTVDELKDQALLIADGRRDEVLFPTDRVVLDAVEDGNEVPAAVKKARKAARDQHEEAVRMLKKAKRDELLEWLAR